MTRSPIQLPLRVAIACGGTGGHLFPGLAVARQLVRKGSEVTLLISPKEVDQQAVKQAQGVTVLTLPAVGLTRDQRLAFVHGFIRSYRAAKTAFSRRPPQAALAMGGFTSAPPLLAARRLGAATFLHESNTIPGRANRWLAWTVASAFVGFPSAARRLRRCQATVTGTPVRPQFHPADARTSRLALGLEPDRPVVLVTGGSQGASGLNKLVLESVPGLAQSAPQWQWIHLAGSQDFEAVRQAYTTLNLKSVVRPFFEHMELVMDAATVAVSRAGASSLAELAAMRLPAVLVPYPAATDNHQFHNARAFEETGAARVLDQIRATPAALSQLLIELAQDGPSRARMQAALQQWHAPRAAEEIADAMLAAVLDEERQAADRPVGSVRRGPARGDRLQKPSKLDSVGKPGGAWQPAP